MIGKGEPSEPLLALKTASSSEGEREEESTEEQEVPTIESHLKQLTLWWRGLKKPILVIVLNLILIGLAGRIIRHGTSAGYHYSWARHEEAVTFKTHASCGLVILVIHFVLDAYFCLCGARELEKRATTSPAERCSGYSEVNQSETAGQEDPERTAMEAPTGTEAPTNSGAVPTKQNEEEEEGSFDYLLLSHSIDELFGTAAGSDTKSTFVVGLLYALFALSGWLLVLSSASLTYIQVVSESRASDMTQCVARPFQRYHESHSAFSTRSSEEQERHTISWLAQQPAAQDIPKEVQIWLQSDGRKYPSYYGLLSQSSSLNNNTSSQAVAKDHGAYFQGSLPYVQATDGSTAFPFQRRNKNSELHRGVALATSNGTGILEFSMNEMSSSLADDDFFHDEGTLTLVGIPSRPPYQGWCGISGKVVCPPVVHPQVLCYNGVDGQVVSYTGGEGDGQSSFTVTRSWSKTYATDATLWLATKQLPEECTESGCINQVYLSLASYNIGTMKRQLIVETQQNKTQRAEFDHYGPLYPMELNPKCHHWWGLFLSISIPVLCLLSFDLYIQGIPSSFVPLSLALFLVTSSTLPSIWPWVVDMSIATIIMLLVATTNGPWDCCCMSNKMWNKLVTLEMLVWAQYSLLACHMMAIGVECVHSDIGRHMLFFGWSRTSDRYTRCFILVPALTCMVAAANAVILNHPVFEMFGIGFGFLSFFSVPILLRLHYRPLAVLFLSLLFGALALVCNSMGQLVRSFRWHAMVHYRRGCRYLQKKQRVD